MRWPLRSCEFKSRHSHLHSSHLIMLEYYLVIKDEHHPDKHIPIKEHWDSRYMWWGPGAETKAKRACKKLNRTLPAFHYCVVESVMTAWGCLRTVIKLHGDSFKPNRKLQKLLGPQGWRSSSSPHDILTEFPFYVVNFRCLITLMPNKELPFPKSKYQVGDRVIHKSNPFSGHRRERHGAVVKVIYKKNARGARFPWFEIKFDNSDRTETFMGSRIAPESTNA